MCGRFTRYLSWSEIVRLYRLTAPAETGRNDAPAYNVAPTDPVPFVTAGENGAHRLREGRWWLVPWWAKEMPKAAMFNARIETADTSGAFKDAFASTRCLIPADGFYEWTKSARPMAARTRGTSSCPGTRRSRSPGCGPTTRSSTSRAARSSPRPAGEPMRQIHDRQPVILDPAVYDAWLDPATPAAEIKPLLGNDLNGAVQFRRVGRQVNQAKYKGADCIEPIEVL